MTEQEALEMYEEVSEEYERFCRENPEAVEYLEGLLTRYRQAIDALEAIARRTQQPIGPIQLGQSRDMVVAEAVVKLAQTQPDVFDALGGTTETKYVLSVDRVRQGIKRGLLSAEEGAALIRKTLSFKVPVLAALPERRKHD